MNPTSLSYMQTSFPIQCNSNININKVNISLLCNSTPTTELDCSAVCNITQFAIFEIFC